jgi:hypothetical protein
MPKQKGTIKVHPLTCGHTGPIRVDFLPGGKYRGVCAQCGADVKVEITLEPPPKIGFQPPPKK